MFQVVSQEKATSQALLSEVLKSTKFILGELLVAKMNLRLIDFDEDSQIGIIRVSNKYSEYLRASLVLINNIAGIKSFFYTKSVSGSLKKLRHEIKGVEGFLEKHT